MPANVHMHACRCEWVWLQKELCDCRFNGHRFPLGEKLHYNRLPIGYLKRHTTAPTSSRSCRRQRRIRTCKTPLGTVCIVVMVPHARSRTAAVLMDGTCTHAHAHADTQTRICSYRCSVACATVPCHVHRSQYLRSRRILVL